MTELALPAPAVVVIPAPRLPADLTALPTVVPGEVVRCAGTRRPLLPRPAWEIVDPAAKAAVAARVAWWSRPWWRRIGPRPPEPPARRRWVRDLAVGWVEQP